MVWLRMLLCCLCSELSRPVSMEGGSRTPEQTADPATPELSSSQQQGRLGPARTPAEIQGILDDIVSRSTKPAVAEE